MTPVIWEEKAGTRDLRQNIMFIRNTEIYYKKNWSLSHMKLRKFMPRSPKD